MHLPTVSVYKLNVFQRGLFFVSSFGLRRVLRAVIFSVEFSVLRLCILHSSFYGHSFVSVTLSCLLVYFGLFFSRRLVLIAQFFQFVNL